MLRSSDLRSLQEAYQNIYEETDGISLEMIEEIVEELVEECVEYGYTLEEAAETVEEAATEYLMELNPYAPAGSKASREYAKSTTATKRGVERKAAIKGAVERVKAKAKGVKAAAGIAGSIAKDEARRAGRAAKQAVVGAVEKKKTEVKSGIKGFLGKAARKVASKAAGAAARLGEEAQQLDEISDRKVQGMLAKREKQDRDSGGISAGYMANRRAQQAAARRNVRTGSKVKVDPILSKAGAAARLGEEYVDEATAMAKRGYDEAPIRQKIAKSTGGGEAADRASALEKKSTFGDANKAKQRQNLARTQRGDFRKTTSSSPGLHGYGHKATNDADRAKQAARGAQRGALTPAEKKQLNREELELDQMIESLVERGYTEQEAYALVAQFTLDESQQARENPEKYEREQSKKSAPVRGERTPMPPRGDKRREDFEKWYAAQRR